MKTARKQGRERELVERAGDARGSGPGGAGGSDDLRQRPVPQVKRGTHEDRAEECEHAGATPVRALLRGVLEHELREEVAAALRMPLVKHLVARGLDSRPEVQRPEATASTATIAASAASSSAASAAARAAAAAAAALGRSGHQPPASAEVRKYRTLAVAGGGRGEGGEALARSRGGRDITASDGGARSDRHGARVGDPRDATTQGG